MKTITQPDIEYNDRTTFLIYVDLIQLVIMSNIKEKDFRNTFLDIDALLSINLCSEEMILRKHGFQSPAYTKKSASKYLKQKNCTLANILYTLSQVIMYS